LAPGLVLADGDTGDPLESKFVLGLKKS